MDNIKKEKEKINENGIILIDKNKGDTSFDVLRYFKKNFKGKYGHSGTLDPLATGLLIVLVGRATKLSDFLLKKDKTYIAEIKLGVKTDTLDITGNVISEDKDILSKKEILDEENLKKVLNKYMGKITQVPPIYSALKYEGKKLYEIAREKKEDDEKIEEILNSKKRNVNIYNINILEIDKSNMTFKIKVDCSSGTYIRTLAEDISNSLGVEGCILNLRRTKLGKFDVKSGMKKEEIQNLKDFKNALISDEEVLENIFENKIDIKEKDKFLNGMLLNIDLNDGYYLIYSEENFVGLGEVKNKKLKRKYVTI